MRKGGISASAEEKQQAWDTARRVYAELQDRGWPDLIVADSVKTEVIAPLERHAVGVRDGLG